MKRVLLVLFFVVIFFNLVLASWYVLHSDLEYNSEIARDFFLMQEITQKKIVFIGPSSSTGLFHGPLWLYVNYPAFFIGNGNPLFVAWGWILFVVVFLISGFFIAKKLFDTKTAYLFTLMISVYCVFHARGFYNPHGAMLVIPAFFFFFIRYIQTLKLKYLLFHVLMAGALIQFQMAIGIPFLMLSFAYIAVVTFKAKKLKHLASYLLIVVLLSNFILFDLRHDFLLSRQTFHFSTTASREQLGIKNYASMLEQRVNFMTTGIEFLRRDPGNANLVIFIVFLAFLFFQFKDKKYTKMYRAFLYFYFGFLLLSMLNGGGILYFYLFPLFPLVFLIFASFITSRYKELFAIIFFAILILNEQNAINDQLLAQKNAFGKTEESWAFMKNVSSKVFQGKEKEFGYFVYSPDVVGYKPKYALNYVQNLYSKNAYYFQKKPVTYLIIAPPPSNNPYQKDDWWKVNLLHVTKKPIKTINFPNGYKIEKYELSEEEVKIPVEPNIDPGTTFR